MDIIIKKATLSDLKQVQEFNLKLFKKEYKDYDRFLNLDWTLGKTGTKYFKDKISKKDGCVLIAFVKDKMVGYLCGGIKQPGYYKKLPVMSELENIFVLEKYRSRGIGGKLYEEFIKWSKTKNVGKIIVMAYTKNKAAIKFYKANNFQEYGLTLETKI